MLYSKNIMNKSTNKATATKKSLITKDTVLKLSLVFNALFIIGSLVYFFVLLPYVNQNLTIAQFNNLQQDICGQHYNDFLKSFPTDQDKKAFAITTCLRNYKTGQDLDLSPLEAQVH